MFIGCECSVAVNTGYGPIGRDMSSVVTVFRALTDPIMFDLDPTIPIMPFSEQVHTPITVKPHKSCSVAFDYVQ